MISINNINKSYGSKIILSDISVDIPMGQVTSLIGANGAGKSTLLMIIAKLLASSSGHISIKGQNIADINTAQYAHIVATLRQTLGFDMRLTVEELVSFGRFPHSRGSLSAEDKNVINESIAFLDLEDLRHCYLDEISGGQRQMAFLAMTIAQKTDVLLLDEPLNNLDMKHAVQVMQALRRLCDEQGRTVILVIHDINFASNYSHNIVALKNGTLSFSGVCNDVITEQNLSALYDLNFEIIHNETTYLCNYFKPQ